MSANNYLIVVGLDGSEASRTALLWAIREAHHRGGAVHAITAWHWEHPELAEEGDVAIQTRAAEELLARELQSVPLYLLSSVVLSTRVAEGRPADVLAAAAHDADLLVLGSHGHNKSVHRVLGSVSEECIIKAACPVVVLPHGYRRDFGPGQVGSDGTAGLVPRFIA